MHTPVDYLDPQLPPGLAQVSIQVVDATEESLRHYGHLVSDPRDCPVEIVRWPAQGTRPVDADTGDQGGTTEGVFVSERDAALLRQAGGGARPRLGGLRARVRLPPRRAAAGAVSGA